MNIKKIINNEIINSCVQVDAIELSIRFSGFNKNGESEYVIYTYFKIEEIEESKYKATPVYAKSEVNLKEFNVQEIEIRLQLFGNLDYELGQTLLDEFYSKYPETSSRNKSRIFRFFDERLTEILSKSIPKHIDLYVFTFGDMFRGKRPDVEIKVGVVFSHFVKPKKFL